MRVGSRRPAFTLIERQASNAVVVLLIAQLLTTVSDLDEFQEWDDGSAVRQGFRNSSGIPDRLSGRLSVTCVANNARVSGKIADFVVGSCALSRGWSGNCRH